MYPLTNLEVLSRSPVSLAKQTEVYTDQTSRLLLEAALRVLARDSLRGVTYRAVAAEAKVSERTVFRYFAAREEFLDAIALELTRRLDLPPPPTSIGKLQEAPDALYRCFERESNLTRAGVHSELHERMRAMARPRWLAVRRLVEAYSPQVTEQRRKFASVNFQYILSANAWHSYRFHFRLTIDESIECAKTSIRQTISGLQS